MKRLRALLGADRGTATIEFALISVFIFGAIMVALDFGFYTQQKLKLGNAVEQAAILAFNSQSTTTASSYVQAYAGTKVTPTVTVTCNGVSTCDGKCSCITASGGFTAPATCASPRASCTGGGTQGYYMKILASETYQAVIVPNRYLGGGTMSQSAVVRLQ